MPLVLTASAATVAVAAITIPLVSHDGAHAPAARPENKGGGAVLVDAHSFLLTGAHTIEAAPAPASGKYWHLQTRRCSNYAPISKGAAVTSKSTPAYRVTACETEDQWSSKTGFVRSIVGLHPKVTFYTPQDKATWQAAGAPALTQRLSYAEDNNPRFAEYGVDNRLSLRQLQAWPTDPARLRKEFAKSAGGGLSGAKLDSYIWAYSPALLAQPITVGTRAGIYRMLAQLPGVRMVGAIKDPEGRPAVAIGHVQHIPARPGVHGRHGAPDRTKAMDVESRLAFQPDTYNFLSSTSGWGTGSETYEQLIAEWTNVLGPRQGVLGHD
jgi:hypothetical protein